jgi:hypothetical protein
LPKSRVRGVVGVRVFPDAQYPLSVFFSGSIVFAVAAYCAVPLSMTATEKTVAFENPLEDSVLPTVLAEEPLLCHSFVPPFGD